MKYPVARWQSLLILSAVTAIPQLASAANPRTFSSLTITPASTNITAGATATTTVALGTKASSGSTAYGAVVIYVGAISPSDPTISTSVNPSSYTINPSSTNNSTLTVTTTASTPVATYTLYVVGNTNPTAGGNFSTPITNTYAMTVASAAANSFSMSVSPASTNVFKGAATNVSPTVNFVDYSATLSGTVTNGVTISPSGQGVTASLNSVYAPITNNFGQTNLVLTISAAANASAGAYTVIVSGTNSQFTANSPMAGVASVTNTFIVVKPAAPPSIQGFSLSEASLTLTGSDGIPDGQYVVLASTNVALPLAQWTPVITNAFDGSGNFNANVGLANTLNSTAAQQFFTLLQRTNLLPGVAMPTFSPAAAPYLADTAVTISTTTSGATIRYTTDGSTPTETHGMVYSTPVTMPEAVDTNLTGFLTNCSGVTMLKAIAYKSSSPGSAVFTGSYEILVPMKYPPSASPVVGIAHVAYHVTAANWSDTLKFWTNYFGFAAVVASNNFALIKINDQQYVELYQGPLDPAQFQLANWGFQVTDAEAYREQLAAAGLSVPPNVSTNALGNISFLTTDPDGHTNEWVEYLTNSVTGQSQGQYMPGTQVFGYINGIGDCTTNETAADNYYIGQCGFVTNQTHDIYVPNVNGYVELLTANPGQVTAALAGKHEKIQLLNFQGLVLSQSVNILTNRDPTIPITLSVEGSVGTKQQNAGDVYDDDGSRVRLVDE